MASFDVVDVDRLEPGERDRLRQESARWDRIGADRQRQDAANAEIGRKLTSRAVRPWKSVRDVAVIAMGQDFNADDPVIEAELGEIFEAARLGLLSRDGRIGIVVTVHGMRPMRLTQQYISDQTYLMRSIELREHVTPIKALAQVARIFLKTAWMTDWAAAAYINIAERRRVDMPGSHELIKPAPAISLSKQYPSAEVEEALRLRYAEIPGQQPNADRDQEWVQSHLGRKIDRPEFRKQRKDLGYTKSRGRPPKIA